MHVRLASDGDVAAIVALINVAYAVETFLDGTRTTEEEVRRQVADRHFLVAVDGSDLAAVVRVEVNGSRGYFGMLAVVPARRRTGLGRLMIESAETIARERGCTHMDITVLSLRVELPALYRAFGYREVGIGPFHPDRGRRLLAPCRCIFMSKDL